MANAILLGLPRLGLGTITIGATEVGTMPKSNLETDEPSNVCRINSADPLKTYIHSTLEMPRGYYGSTFDVGGVGIVNHNLSLGATSRTLLLGSGVSTYVPERVLPTSKTDVTGTWSGAFGDVDDDPYSADANKNTCSYTSSLTPSVLYEFATPSANPKTGTDLQLIRVKVSWTGSAPNSMSIAVDENGGWAGTTLDIDINGSGGIGAYNSGVVILAPWDASNLTTASGADVRAEVTFSIDSGTDVSIEAIDWLCDVGVSGGSILWDSGWEAATYDEVDAGYGSTVSGSVGAALTQTHLAWSSTGDISSVASAVTFFRDPLNSAGYIDVGCYVVGPIFQPELNRAYGELVGVQDLSVKRRTHGGQTFGVNRPRLRVLSLPLGELTTTEAHTLFERLYWRKGILSPVLVSLFPGDTTEGKHTTIWATLENAGDMGVKDESGWRQMAMTFVEKL